MSSAAHRPIASMDPFIERFAKHAAHDRLREILTVAQKLIVGVDASDPASAIRLCRIADGVEFAIGRLTLVDARWVGTGPLAKLEQHSQELLNTVQKYSGDKNPVHLKQANTHLDDGLLVTIAALPFPNSVNEAAGAMHKLLQDLREKSRLDLASLRETATELGQLLNDRKNDLSKLDGAIGEQTNRVTKQNERVDAAIAELNKRAADLEQQREIRFIEFQKDEAAKQSDRLNEHVQTLDKIVARTNTVSHETLHSLEDTRSKVSKIYGTIGNEVLTGDYRRTANENETAANSLRRGAILALTAMALLIAAVVFTAGSDQISWPAALFRLTAAITLAGFAAYLARESGRHRAVAEKMRRLELELASIDAFIALLPDEQRNALKVQLAGKYFANQPEPDAPQDLGFRDIMKEARAFIRALRKGS